MRRPAAIVIAVSVLLVILALAFGHNPSVRASAAGDIPPETAAPPAIDMGAVQPAAPLAKAAPLTSAVAIESASRVKASTVVPGGPKPSEPVAVRATDTPAKLVPLSAAPLAATSETAAGSAATLDAAPGSPATEASATVDRVSQAPVTITGCLEATADGRDFRLTDTAGDGAPKTRGWRSGFIKKRPAAVELIGVPDPAGSRKHVGHRVSATGILESREMRVKSLVAAGSRCD